jgi:hypothetical protein
MRTSRRRRLRLRRVGLGRQEGIALVEAVVAAAILGGALAMMIGAFSTVSIGTTVAKRSAAAQVAINYEIEKVIASTAPPASYSECFGNENVPVLARPPLRTAFPGDACPSGFFLRADVVYVGSAPGSSAQEWKVSTFVQPDSSIQAASPVTFYKAVR